MTHASDAQLFLVAEKDPIASVFLPSNWNDYRELCLSSMTQKYPKKQEYMEDRRRVFEYEPGQSDISMKMDVLQLPFNLARIAMDYPEASSYYEVDDDAPPLLEGGGVIEEMNLLKRDIAYDLDDISRKSQKLARQLAHLAEHFEFCLGSISLYKNKALSQKLESVVETFYNCEVKKEETPQKSTTPQDLRTLTQLLAVTGNARTPAYKGVKGSESSNQGKCNRYKTMTVPVLKKEVCNKVGKTEKEVQKELHDKLRRKPIRDDWLNYMLQLCENDNDEESLIHPDDDEEVPEEDVGLNNAGIQADVKHSFVEIYGHILEGQHLNNDVSAAIETHLKIAFALANDPKAIEELRKKKGEVGDFKKHFEKITAGHIEILEEKLKKKTMFNTITASIKVIFEYCQVVAFDLRKQFALVRHVVLKDVKIGDKTYDNLQMFAAGAWGALLKTPSIGKHIAKFCVNSEVSNAMQYLRLISCIAQGKNLFHVYLMKNNWLGSQVNVRTGFQLFIYDIMRDGDLSTLKNNIKARFNLESSLICGGIRRVSTVLGYLVGAFKHAILTIPRIIGKIPVVNVAIRVSQTVIYMTLKAPSVILSKFCILSTLGGIGLQSLYMTAPGRNLSGKINEIVNENIYAFRDVDKIKSQIDDDFLSYEIDYLTSTSYFDTGWFGKKNRIEYLTCYADLAEELKHISDDSEIKNKQQLETKLNYMLRRHKNDDRKLEFQKFKERYDTCERDLRSISNVGVSNVHRIRSLVLAPYRVFADPNQEIFRKKIHDTTNMFTDLTSHLEYMALAGYNFKTAEETAARSINYVVLNDDNDVNNGDEIDQAKYDQDVSNRANQLRKETHPLYRRFTELKVLIPPLLNKQRSIYKGVEFASIEGLKEHFKNDKVITVLIDSMIEHTKEKDLDDHDRQTQDDFNWSDIYKRADLKVYEDLKKIVATLNPLLEKITVNSDYIMEDSYFLPHGTAKQDKYDEKKMERLIGNDYLEVYAYWYSKDAILNLPRLHSIISWWEFSNRKYQQLKDVAVEAAMASMEMLEASAGAMGNLLTGNVERAWEDTKRVGDRFTDAAVNIADKDIFHEGMIGRIASPVANMVIDAGAWLGYSTQPALLPEPAVMLGQRAEKSIWPAENKSKLISDVKKSEFFFEDISSLTYRELQLRCMKLGLGPCSGNGVTKNELIHRLQRRTSKTPTENPHVETVMLFEVCLQNDRRKKKLTPSDLENIRKWYVRQLSKIYRVYPYSTFTSTRPRVEVIRMKNSTTVIMALKNLTINQKLSEKAYITAQIYADPDDDGNEPIGDFIVIGEFTSFKSRKLFSRS